jgi:hypothetical protein
VVAIKLGDKPALLWIYLDILVLKPIVVAFVGYFVTSALKRREYNFSAAELPPRNLQGAL